jgi:hypothetical protein
MHKAVQFYLKDALQKMALIVNFWVSRTPHSWSKWYNCGLDNTLWRSNVLSWFSVLDCNVHILYMIILTKNIWTFYISFLGRGWKTCMLFVPQLYCLQTQTLWMILFHSFLFQRCTIHRQVYISTYGGSSGLPGIF